MTHDRADQSRSAQGQDGATTPAGPERADAYVVQLIREHGPYAGPLAAAIKATGRAHDPEVFAALHRVLGSSIAQDVIAKATATTSRHATANNKGAHAALERETHDGDTVHKTKGVGADLAGDAATVHAGASKTTTHDEGSHTKKGGVEVSRDRHDTGIAASAERSTTETTGGVTNNRSTHGKIGLERGGPTGSIGHAKTSTSQATDADGNVTSATSDSSTKSLAIDKDGATAAAGRTASTTTAGGHQVSAGANGSVHLGPESQGIAAGGNVGGKSATGYGGHLGFHFEASRTKHEKTKDGMTTLEIDTHVASEVSAGIDAKHVGIHGSKSEGKNSEFVASVPEAAAKGLDLARLDPSSPKALPVGASLRLDSAKFKGSSLGVTLEGLGVSSGQTKSKGTSLLIEKLDANHVRVTQGPTEALSRVTSLGVDFGVAGVALLGSVELKEATLHSAEFDISLPEGDAAYGKFVGGGHAPAAEGPGVSKLSKVERFDATSQASIGAHVGPIGGALHGEKSEAHLITTTHADGSKDVDNAAGRGDKRSEYHEHIDEHGKTTEEKFTLVLRNHDTVDQLLRVLPGVKLKPKAKEFRYELTRAELESLYQLAKRAGAAMHAWAKGLENMDPLIRMLESSSSPTEFFTNFSYNSNSYEQAFVLETISDNLDGKVDGKLTALPGHVA